MSLPLRAKISVTSASQTFDDTNVSADYITVNGTGFSTLTVINFYNSTPGGVVNLGGIGAGGPNIPLTLISPNQFSFFRPLAAVPGPSYVQVLNPPFVPFTCSGTDPGGAFILAGPFLTGKCVGPAPEPLCFPYIECCEYLSTDTTSCPIGETAIAPKLICNSEGTILRIDSARRCTGFDPYDHFGLTPEYCEAKF